MSFSQYDSEHHLGTSKHNFTQGRHVGKLHKSAQAVAAIASKACEARRTLVACQKSTRSWLRVMRGVASLGNSTSSFSEALCMHHTLPSSFSLCSSKEKLSEDASQRPGHVTDCRGRTFLSTICSHLGSVASNEGACVYQKGCIRWEMTGQQPQTALHSSD